MAVEIEAKMQISSVDAMAGRLRDVGGAYHGTVLERNVYFDTPSGALKAADEGLRVRHATCKGESNGRAVMTYKGPRQPRPLKTRREIEFVVDDAAAAEAMLTALKYKKVLAFEKQRQTWQVDACEVVLDTLPHLGEFLEIEGPSEHEVESVRRCLRLDQTPLITTSYLGLICAYLDDHGLGRADLSFEEHAD